MMAVVGEFSAKDLEVQYHISLQSKLLCRNHARRWISQTELKKHLKMKIFFSVRFSSFLLSLSLSHLRAGTITRHLYHRFIVTVYLKSQHKGS